MGDLLKDKNGKLCNAKLMYNITVITCLAKVIISGMTFGDWNGGVVDFTGLGLIIGASGGVYWGRNKTKEENPTYTRPVG